MRKTEIVIIIIIVAVVGALFAFKIIDYETLYGKVRGLFYRAPDLLKGPQPGNLQNAETCRNNLKMIESAKRRAAENLGLTTGGRLSWEQVCKAVGWKEPPKCPEGGTYTLNPIGNLPTCSISDHGTLDKSDDHIIFNY